MSGHSGLRSSLFGTNSLHKVVLSNIGQEKKEAITSEGGTIEKKTEEKPGA